MQRKMFGGDVFDDDRCLFEVVDDDGETVVECLGRGRRGDQSVELTAYLGVDLVEQAAMCCDQDGEGVGVVFCLGYQVCCDEPGVSVLVGDDR